MVLETTESKTWASCSGERVDSRAHPDGSLLFLGRAARMQDPKSALQCLWLFWGGFNRCNEWLITSSHPGGCWYFQLIKRPDEPSV